jgi:hypothetical protein
LTFSPDKNDSQLKLEPEIAKYVLQKIEWLMPYYIDLLWQRLEDLCCDNDITNPSRQHVDEAFELLFHSNYRTTFNHWAECLQRFPRERV